MHPLVGVNAGQPTRDYYQIDRSGDTIRIRIVLRNFITILRSIKAEVYDKITG